MDIPIPQSLTRSCQYAPESNVWLADLPALIAEVKESWNLELGEPFDGDEVSCSWVAPVTRADGTSAILKIGMPHMEGLHELEGLLYWKGNHCFRVLDYIEVEHNRVRLWMFARAAAEPRQVWEENELLKFARAIAP